MQEVVGKCGADMLWMPVTFEPDDPNCVWEVNKRQLWFADDIPDSVPAWSLSALWDMVRARKKVFQFDTDMRAEEVLSLLVDAIANS